MVFVFMHVLFTSKLVASRMTNASRVYVADENPKSPMLQRKLVAKQTPILYNFVVRSFVSLPRFMNFLSLLGVWTI